MGLKKEDLGSIPSTQDKPKQQLITHCSGGQSPGGLLRAPSAGPHSRRCAHFSRFWCSPWPLALLGAPVLTPKLPSDLFDLPLPLVFSHRYPCHTGLEAQPYLNDLVVLKVCKDPICEDPHRGLAGTSYPGEGHCVCDLECLCQLLLALCPISASEDSRVSGPPWPPFRLSVVSLLSAQHQLQGFPQPRASEVSFISRTPPSPWNPALQSPPAPLQGQGPVPPHLSAKLLRSWGPFQLCLGAGTPQMTGLSQRVAVFSACPLNPDCPV